MCFCAFWLTAVPGPQSKNEIWVPLKDVVLCKKDVHAAGVPKNSRRNLAHPSVSLPLRVPATQFQYIMPLPNLAPNKPLKR